MYKKRSNKFCPGDRTFDIQLFEERSHLHIKMLQKAIALVLSRLLRSDRTFDIQIFSKVIALFERQIF
ncbi:MAG: hypothetical protein MET45_26510 [Nostoc sp. LLA-1]|nr:hypothetical protein [Cyanocohniella sp. LLY]